MPMICSHEHVHHLENPIRRMLHRPDLLFAPWTAPGMRVLDMGCGGGFAAIPIAHRVGETGVVVAADLQPEMLEKLLVRARHENVADFIHPHICHLDSIGVEGSYDFINAFWMLHEVPDYTRHVAEIRSLIRPRGHFFFSEPLCHVPAKQFEAEHRAILAAGFREVARPRVLMGRTRVYTPR